MIKTLTKAATALFGGPPVPQTGSSLFRTGKDPQKRTTQGLLDAYSERPYLAGPADAIASDVGCVEWELYAVRGGPSGERYVRPLSVQRSLTHRTRTMKLAAYRDLDLLDRIESHPLLDLLYDPNPELVGAQVMKLIQLHLDLVGDAPSLVVRHEGGPLRGLPAQVWPIPVTWLRTEAGRLYIDPPQSSMRLRISPDDLLVVRDVNPSDPYHHGVGVARSVTDELDIAEYAAKEVKSRLFNGSLPDFIVRILDAPTGELRRARMDFEGRHMGPFRRGGGWWTNKDVKLDKISQSFADLQVKDLLPEQRDAIRMRFGVPPEILGDVKNSNRATISAAEMIYMKRCVVPRMERLRQVIQSRLVPEYDERLVLHYVSPVPNDDDFQLEVMKAMPIHFRRDEWRDLADHAPAESGEQGDDFFGSPLMQPVREGRAVDRDGTPVLRLVPGTKGRFTDEDAADAFWAAIQRVSDRLEPRVRERFLDGVAALQDAVGDDFDRIVQALRTQNVDAVVAAIPWEKFRGAFAGASGELRGLMLAAMEETAKLAAQEAAAAIGATIAFDIENARAIEAARTRAATLIVQTTDTMKETVRQIVARSFEAGAERADRAVIEEVRERIGLTSSQEGSLARFEESLREAGGTEAQIARRVERQRNAMLRRRGQTIARTETIWSANAGQHELIQQAIDQNIVGRQEIRRYVVVTPDERLCSVCEPMPFLEANQNIGPDDLFTTGDGQMLLHAPFHVTCRCGVGWEVKKDDRTVTLNLIARAIERLREAA